MIKLIGYSLSHCVNDILDGRVNYDDVLRIETNTLWRTPKDKREGIARYTELLWKNNPDASAIAEKLFTEGKIIQPLSITGFEGKKFTDRRLIQQRSAEIHWRNAETHEPYSTPEMVKAGWELNARAEQVIDNTAHKTDPTELM